MRRLGGHDKFAPVVRDARSNDVEAIVHAVVEVCAPVDAGAAAITANTRWGRSSGSGSARRRCKRRSGRAVSLAHPWNTVGAPGNWSPAQHYLRTSAEYSIDFIGISFHGYATTHIDALSQSVTIPAGCGATR